MALLSILCYLFSFILLSVHAVTLTVFDVLPTNAPPQSVSLSPLGVGPDGETTYDYVEVDTAQLVSDPATIFTASIPAVTFHATFIAGANHNRNSFNPQPSQFPSVMSNCTWGVNGEGTCVAEILAPDLTATITTTATGQVAPIYTLTVEDQTAGQHPSSQITLPSTIHSGRITITPIPAPSESQRNPACGLIVGSKTLFGTLIASILLFLL